jgi:hypothetical protein
MGLFRTLTFFSLLAEFNVKKKLLRFLPSVVIVEFLVALKPTKNFRKK